MKILPKLFKKIKRESKSPVNDRRQVKRYDVPLKIDYFDPRTNLRGESLTKNISKNGLRFPVTAKIAKGTMLDMKIEDPHSNALIDSKAKVIWADDFITGDDANDMIYEVGVRLLKKLLY